MFSWLKKDSKINFELILKFINSNNFQILKKDYEKNQIQFVINDKDLKLNNLVITSTIETVADNLNVVTFTSTYEIKNCSGYSYLYYLILISLGNQCSMNSKFSLIEENQVSFMSTTYDIDNIHTALNEFILIYPYLSIFEGISKSLQLKDEDLEAFTAIGFQVKENLKNIREKYYPYKLIPFDQVKKELEYFNFEILDSSDNHFIVTRDITNKRVVYLKYQTEVSCIAWFEFDYTENKITKPGLESIAETAELYAILSNTYWYGIWNTRISKSADKIRFDFPFYDLKSLRYQLWAIKNDVDFHKNILNRINSFLQLNKDKSEEY